jgi:glycine dehydrogenase
MPDSTSHSLAEHAADAPFVARHVGPRQHEIDRMLATVGYDSLDALTDAAAPASIRSARALSMPAPVDERTVLEELRRIAGRNQRHVQMIGLGYADTVTPPVVVRRLLESPGWYTAYTPYQPEISQGRLEALLNFQTMVEDLTALPVANASLLDEATAVAEAVTLMLRGGRGPSAASRRILVDADVLPQTLAVVQTRAEPLGVTVESFEPDAGLPDGDVAGIVLQYPGASGAVRDHEALVAAAHERGALATVAADLLALTLLRPPGEIGADIVVGTSQRFGVPLGYGGPHAGFIAVRRGLERSLPGRLVGVSVDADGHPAYRLALQTREQHIRREKATSNICTAQVLLAIVASMYAVWHGPDGLTTIARRVHDHARTLAARLRAGGVHVVHDTFFDTVLARVPGQAERVRLAALARDINVGIVDADHVRVACDEVTTEAHLQGVLAAFGVPEPVRHQRELADQADDGDDTGRDGIPTTVQRTSPFLSHPVFHRHRSETAMLRYLRSLADKDYALDRGMIPLGSCTMKLNGTTEMEAVTWPELASLHPFCPPEQASGYQQIIEDLCRWLAEITGYDAVSLQPNAGSQGELAGLLAIRAYHRSRGEQERTVCIVPASAHGTNAASAVMAGMRVVVVRSAEGGSVDLDHLRELLDVHAGQVAAAMVTYPSTHGVYEEGIVELCDLVHAAGGQVYVDGANLNALVGVARPGEFGADVSHLNLHKTFAIPHGGGGPGVGPIGVRAHLAPFLPNHPLRVDAGPASGPGPVAAAPFGSAGVLVVPWVYLRLLGADGLRRSTQVAVLSANYVAARLREHYPVLYTGAQGLVAHECILDLRPLTKATGVTVDDVAKRLADYGFHAPTMSFPVAGTLMVEPTESEDLAELDRFCDAMAAVRAEIDRVASGEWPAEDNPLRNAPHTAASLVGEWTHPYSRETAVYPAGPRQIADKYWPPVRRVDGAYGDRNLVCACPAPEELAAR